MTLVSVVYGVPHVYLSFYFNRIKSKPRNSLIQRHLFDRQQQLARLRCCCKKLFKLNKELLTKEQKAPRHVCQGCVFINRT
jgi:hypothetical protein